MPFLSFTQSSIQTALVSFLSSFLAPGMDIVEGQDNRVPEPSGSDFVVFWVLRRDRLSTNVDSFADCAFTASISGSVLNVTNVILGTIATGNLLFGSGVPVNTTVTGQLSGTGGVGTYSINGTLTVGSEIMATGASNALQPVQVVMQLDVHGPNSSENAQMISTLFRDDYAFQIFKNSGFDIAPLYADDPKQIPFINAESQYEYRWVVEAYLQANQVVLGLPLQAASTITLTTESVTRAFPH